MAERRRATAGGVGFLGLLTLLLIALKLTGVITWSWWVVLAPLWIPAIPALIILAAVVLAAIAAGNTHHH